MRKRAGIVLLTTLCALSGAPPREWREPLPHAPRAFAAEFDIDSGRVVLRKLQYCADCGSALLVTDVRGGERIRCPDCGKEQPRLEDEFLLTQLYQICKLCSGPLNPEGRHAGDVVECAVCGTRQELVADAFAKGDKANGLGFRPGFPPGTGKKTLLLSPNRPEARITAIPLDMPDAAPDSAPAAAGAMAEPPLPDSPVLAKIPAPPAGFAREKPVAAPPPPLPESAPSGSPASPPQPEPGALDVPAVTADLFGGARRAAGESGAFAAPGAILARVDGAPIHARDVDQRVLPVMERLRARATPADADTLAQREQELRREVLSRLIDRELALREAGAIGYQPDQAAVRARESELAPVFAGSGVDFRREAERDVILAGMRRRFAEKPASVTPTAVREFYRLHKDEMRQPRLLALDQLVIYEERAGRADPRPAREIALAVATALESGEAFEELRRRHDEFLSAAGLARAAPALKPESAYASQVLAAGGDLRTGGVFGPVPMAGMFLFAKVADTRPAGPVPFSEAEKTIRAHLESQAADAAFAAWLAALRARATIEIAQ